MTNETAAIARSEKRFRALVHGSTDVVMICAADGTITYASPTAQSEWGYAAGALLNTPIAALVHPDDQAAWRDFSINCAVRGTGYRTSAPERRRDVGAERSHSDKYAGGSAVSGLVATAATYAERQGVRSATDQTSAL